jgi:hypothetical protein
MELTLLYFADCPNWKMADEALKVVARDLPDVTIKRQPVETIDEATRLGFRGSPSILVDGIDIFADAETPVGLSCRRYQTPTGPAGSPTVDQLRAALTRS